MQQYKWAYREISTNNGEPYFTLGTFNVTNVERFKTNWGMRRHLQKWIHQGLLPNQVATGNVKLVSKHSSGECIISI